MAEIIPITLRGDNLGKRHMFLNSLVNEVFMKNEVFENIECVPEKSPIDRLFKIDLASKNKIVNYIVKNLKDEDMLYVSRALKSTWLIENEEIINPNYLERSLYPEMITTAITKMEHWLHLNLKDQTRCHVFYKHYLKKNSNLAMKFLVKCSEDTIKAELPHILKQINPHILKILCEKCIAIVKIFYDLINTNEEIKRMYLDKQSDYFNVLKYFLKVDANLVLDIYEKYFNADQFKKFNRPATKFIMKFHKIRFTQKPELYTVYFLHLETLAECLSSEECKKLVIKLARAKYLRNLNWSSYKKVKPLIERLNPEERAEFKKKVFVAKDIGEEEEVWPYEPPAVPYTEQYDVFATIFDDYQPEPESYQLKRYFGAKRKIKKRCGMRSNCVDMCGSMTVKTLLDRLFDEFRFISFGQTLYDLRKRIAAESSPQNREFMILVLVSKSGGRPDAVASLLELLAQHGNEPPNVRAAIIRSLVKRTHVWRLPEETWNHLLKFGQDLGLDGKPAVADCDEGLHAVVIRSLILYGKCQPEIQKAFLDKFSYLNNYDLSTTEKKLIAKLLPQIVLNVAKENENVRDALHWIDKLIDTLHAYKINVETYPGLIETIYKYAQNDESEAKSLLTNLFNSKVARKELFRWTFNLIKTDASYVNALRHDLSVINIHNFADNYINGDMTHIEQFLRKLCIYFDEKDGLASKFLDELTGRGLISKLGRPLAILLGSKLKSYLLELDAIKSNSSKLLSASIRANAHTTRPLFDIESFGWENSGAKLVANRVLICRSKEIVRNIENLLSCKKTTRLALQLSKRVNQETEILIKVANIKPKVAMKHGLKLIKLQLYNDDKTWETIKPIIQGYNLKGDKMKYITKSLASIKDVSLKIRPDYSTVIYTLFKKHSMFEAIPSLCQIELILENINEIFIENLLEQFLAEDFIVSKLPKEYEEKRFTCLYVRILIKFLFLCKNKDTQKTRWDKFGEPFLAQMEEISQSDDHKDFFVELLNVTFLTLKYSKVFLNTQYVSALPVMEHLVIWVQKRLPLEEHFEKYTKLHLCMLYSKAVRKSVSLFPEIFSDERKIRKEGVEVVGKILGRYVAREVKTLAERYFNSITELYAKALVSYLDEYTISSLSSDLLVSLLKGILEESQGQERLIGIYVMSHKSNYLSVEHCKEVKDILKEITDPAVQIMAYSEIFV